MFIYFASNYALILEFIIKELCYVYCVRGGGGGELCLLNIPQVQLRDTHKYVKIWARTRKFQVDIPDSAAGRECMFGL